MNIKKLYTPKRNSLFYFLLFLLNLSTFSFLLFIFKTGKKENNDLVIFSELQNKAKIVNKYEPNSEKITTSIFTEYPKIIEKVKLKNETTKKIINLWPYILIFIIVSFFALLALIPGAIFRLSVIIYDWTLIHLMILPVTILAPYFLVNTAVIFFYANCFFLTNLDNKIRTFIVFTKGILKNIIFFAFLFAFNLALMSFYTYHLVYINIDSSIGSVLFIL